MLKETEKYGIVNRLKSSTYSTVSDNQKKLIPIEINNKDEFIEEGNKVIKTNRIFATDRYHYIDKWYSYRYSSDKPENNFSIIKVNNLPFRSFFNRYNKDYFMSRLDRMVYTKEIEPFLLFIDGKFIDWNDIIIVYDAGDIYLLIYNDKFNHFVIKHSKDIYLLILPFNINYISKDTDKVFNMYYNAYCKYMNDNAFIKNNKIYVSVPDINDQYKYNGIYLDIGWWLITQLKLNYLGLLSEDRLKKLKNISVNKYVYNEFNEIVQSFVTIFNSFDRDSYDNAVLEMFRNESIERCINNNIFRFNSQTNLLDETNGDIIISEFSDEIDIYKYSSNDEYIKNILCDVDNTLFKENYIVFEDGLFKYNPDVYTWVCNSSIIHNPDRHKCNVIIVNNNTVNSVHYNMNNFYKPYIKQLAIKYFNIMVDNNYFILNSNTGKINSKFEILTEDILESNGDKILTSDSESIKYDTIYNTQTNEVINIDASNKDKLYIALLESFNKSLDFSYDYSKAFSDNLNNAFKSVFDYNTLLFNELYKSNISSTVINGSEANKWINKPFMYESSKGLKIPRMKYKDHETYAMVFINGELIDTYNEMVIYPNFMFIPVYNNFKSSDEIELLYFNNCNNNEFNFSINEELLKYIQASNDSIKYNEKNALLVSDSDNISYSDKTKLVSINDTNFKFDSTTKLIKKVICDSIKYKYDPVLKKIVTVNGNTISYIEKGKPITQTINDGRIKLLKSVYNLNNIDIFNDYFNNDSKIFSRYPEDMLVYKELIKDSDDISFNVSCRDDKNDLYILSDATVYDLVATGSTRFVYQLLKIDQRAYKIRLDRRFRYCDNQKQYMLFINGRRMPDEIFLITIPKYNRPFDYMYIYLTKFVSPEDRIELFYLPTEVLDINLDSSVQIQDNGYIEARRNTLEVPYDNRLYMLFINGKKISSSDLINVDSRTFRLKKDTKSKLSLMISPIYSNTISEITDYLKSNNCSKYEELINVTKHLFSYDELDRLFNTFIKISNTEEDKFIINVDRIAIINEIVRDFWISSGYDYNHNPFIYDYELDEFIHIDDNGNQILPSMDANPNINIIKEQLHLLYFLFDGNNTSGYVELGRIIKTPVFEWEYSQYAYNFKQDIISQQFNDIQLDPQIRRFKYPENISSDISFTIKAFDGFSICSSTIDIKFVSPIYYGLVDEDSLQHFDEDLANSFIPLNKLYALDKENNIYAPISILNQDGTIEEIDPDESKPTTGVTEYMFLEDMIPVLNKSLQETCKLSLTDYVIGCNNYFVYVAPKRYVYNANGKLNIGFFLPDLTNELLEDNMDEHTTPIYTDGTFDPKNNTLTKLYDMKMVFLGEFEYTNEYGYSEQYVAFRTNGFFTRKYDATKFNIYVRSNS